MESELEVRKQLAAIKNLKRKIEARLWASAKPISDSHNVELTAIKIESRIYSLAKQLEAKHPKEYPVLLCLMDGALPFASKLADMLTIRNYDFQMTNIQVSSYRGGLSSGELTMGEFSKVELGERLVIVVDDVLDTGKTYDRVRQECLNRGAKGVELMTLVDKTQRRENGVSADFVGFKISSGHFIVGFGLDYLETLRHMPAIMAVNMDELPTQKEKALLDLEKPLNAKLREIMAKKDNPKHGETHGSLFKQAYLSAILPQDEPDLRAKL